MVVCVECLPADKPWDVVSVTRLSSGVAPRACVRVYARVLVPPNLYIHTYRRGLRSEAMGTPKGHSEHGLPPHVGAGGRHGGTATAWKSAKIGHFCCAQIRVNPC